MDNDTLDTLIADIEAHKSRIRIEFDDMKAGYLAGRYRPYGTKRDVEQRLSKMTGEVLGMEYALSYLYQRTRVKQMTKRDFELVAKAIRDTAEVAYAQGKSDEVEGICKVAIVLAERFTDANPRFSIQKFLDACAPRAEIVKVADETRASL